jgi:hypothetical protein
MVFNGWRAWAQRYTGKRSGSSDRGRRSRRRWEVEALEERVVPAGTWTPLSAISPSPDGFNSMMLLTDGTVMLSGGNDNAENAWYKLTPDSSGNYVNGTFSSLASMNVYRLFYGSNVLPNGNVFVIGGEYSDPNTDQNFNNTAETYNPLTNKWTMDAQFPQTSFGDDPTVVLSTGPNTGKILCGYVSGPQTYLYDPATDTWTQSGTKLNNDQSDEEAWIKLSDGSILSYNVFASNSAQRYIPATGQWVPTGSVPVQLADSNSELGAGLLLQNGLVLQLGATSNTALYNPTTNTWVAGPQIPNNDGCDDAPAAELPDGNVIFAADAGNFSTGVTLYEYNPTTNQMTTVAVPQALGNDLANTPAFDCRMLVLPNGHLLFNDRFQLWDFNPGDSPPAAVLPTISGIVANGNNSFTLTGTQLNGPSEGAGYGDDVEMAENYPIIELQDQSTGIVYFGRTTNWLSQVATGSALVSTDFTLPANVPQTDTYNLTVIADGIASNPIPFSFAPTISKIGPTSTAVEGSKAFTLNVFGSFSANAQIIWNGQPLTTTFTLDPQNGPTLSAKITTAMVAEDGNIPIQVYVAGNAPGFQYSNTVFFNITEAALTVGPGQNFTVQAGTSFTQTSAQPLASFTDADPNELTTDYTATIRWGDGSIDSPGQIVATATPGQYYVTGTHTYSIPGLHNVVVIINDDGVANGVVKDTVLVNGSVLIGSGVTPALQLKQGASFTGQVASFTDTDPSQPATAYTATISWGDKTSSAGVITATSTPGQFTVAGTHTYGSPGLQTITINIVRTATGASTAPTTLANVQPVSLTPGASVTLTSTEGHALSSVVVGSFNDPDLAQTAADFTASIDWGDGTATSAGKIKSLGGGNYQVLGTHTYADEGAPAVTATLFDDGTKALTLNASATVKDALLAGQGASIGATAGKPFSSPVVLGTFTDGNPLAGLGDFSATINWGDGSSNTSFDGQGALNILTTTGGFKVTGTHTYAATGNYSYSIVVADIGGNSKTITGTVAVRTTGGTTGGGGGTGGSGATGGTVVVGADAGNLPEVQVLNSSGTATLTLQAYPSTFKGGVRVASGTLGTTPVIITAPGAGIAPTIKIFNESTGQLLNSFPAFGGSFTGGLYVAFGDVNGDGTPDLAVSEGSGGSPLVEVFNGNTLRNVTPSLLGPSFYALSSTFRGGSTVAIGGGKLVVGSGPGGPPVVNVYGFNGASFVLQHSFQAFNGSFTGGVFVAVGDFTGAGHPDIIAGAGPGWLPQVNVFDMTQLGSSTNPTPLTSYLAYTSTYKGGVRVAAIPVPGTSHVDIWTVPGGGGASAELVEAAFQSGGSPLLFDRAALNAVFAGGAFID